MLRVAVGSLTGPEAEADAERFRRLAAFPDGEPIPCAELARLWELSHDETWAAAGRLEAVDVVERRDGAVRIPFKRSLLLIDAVDVARLHDVLVRAYRDLCGRPGDWATLPPQERHAWDHLVFHAEGTGDRDLLRGIVTDTAFLARHAWIAQSPHAVERDLDLAADAVAADGAASDGAVAWLRRFIGTAGHLLAGHPDEASLAASLRLLLVDAPAGVSVDRLDALLPPVFLEPLWRRPRRLNALVREVCPVEQAVDALAWSPDGRLAAVGADARLRVWADEPGATPRDVPLDDEALGALAYLPDGRLARGLADGRVEVRSRGASAAAIGTASGAGVRTVCASGDGGRLAWCDEDGNAWIAVADPATADGWRARPAGSATAVALSRDGALLLCGADDGTVTVRDPVDGGDRAAPQPVSDASIVALALSPAADHVAAVDADQVLRVWRVEDGARLAATAWRWQGEAQALAFGPAADRLLIGIGTGDGSVLLWRMAEDAEPIVLVHDPASRVPAIAFHPDGTRLASGDSFGRLRVWDVGEAERHRLLEREMAGIRAVAMSPDGQALATGRGDGKVALQPASDGDAPQQVLGDPDGTAVTMLAFSGDSSALAWASAAGGEVRVAVDGVSGIRTLRSPAGVMAIALSPRGDLLAAGCADGAVRLWSTAGPEVPVREVRAGDHRAARVVAFPGDRQVLVAARDALLAWDPEGDAPEAFIPAAGGPISALAAAGPDGPVALGLTDGRVLVGDRHGLAEIAVARHPRTVNALAFSQDGALLASAAVDGSAQLVELATDDVLVRADAGIRGLGLAWAGGAGSDHSGSRLALLLDGAVLVARMVDRR